MVLNRHTSVTHLLIYVWCRCTVLCGRKKPCWWSVALKRVWEEKMVQTLHYGMTTTSMINPPAVHPWMNSERCCIPSSRSLHLLHLLYCQCFTLKANITVNQTCSWQRSQFYSHKMPVLKFWILTFLTWTWIVVVQALYQCFSIIWRYSIDILILMHLVWNGFLTIISI